MISHPTPTPTTPLPTSISTFSPPTSLPFHISDSLSPFQNTSAHRATTHTSPEIGAATRAADQHLNQQIS
ncbi:hypothetical protein BofuT4_uP014640.1 [Botrytis cinerea T4]|uniref:Uncharacterized protein n=1 Tax=Botryotinia fuckeliana (strain T4) TaxID=999810 RepID=G2XN80_BOTF4|nr:hypothetical protein BofuT4_uP014640.1 [Botrytis cinerea T4]